MCVLGSPRRQNAARFTSPSSLNRANEAVNAAFASGSRRRARWVSPLRRFTEAEHFLIAEIARLPNYTTIRLELAWTYAQMERPDDGVVQYVQALEIDPAQPSVAVELCQHSEPDGPMAGRGTVLSRSSFTTRGSWPREVTSATR